MAIIRVMSAVIATGATQTSTSFDASQYGSVSVFLAISGTLGVATAPTVTVKSFYSDFQTAITLIAFTANNADIHYFKLGDAGQSTGTTTGATGLNVFGRLSFEVANPASVTRSEE